MTGLDDMQLVSTTHQRTYKKFMQLVSTTHQRTYKKFIDD